MTQEEVAARIAALERFSTSFNAFAASYNAALSDMASFEEEMFRAVRSSLNQMATSINFTSPAITAAKKKLIEGGGVGYFGDGYFGKTLPG